MSHIRLTSLFRSFLLLILILSTAPLSAQDDLSKSVQYFVDLTDAKNHYARVTVRVPASGDKTQMMMAVWTPGSYLIREYARNIDEVVAVNIEGEQLPIEKVRKNRWEVDSSGQDEVFVVYRIYLNEMTVRTSFLGREYAMLNGASVFLTVADRMDEKHIVTMELPKKWTRSATSLKAYGDQTHQYIAQDFDELVDSPIVAGNIQIYPFEAGGIQHQLVNVGESGFWDGTKAATDLKQIVEAHHDMWGNVPYDRYLFLNMIVGRGGGLEHDNSTVVMTSRWSFRDAGRYRDWLSLCSHEFFHTWNIRRLRPKSLVKYDYENEVYTPSLWIGEGVTSYYEDLLLARAGLFSTSEYLRRLSSNIETVQGTAGRLKQSLTDSSYDTWIKFYRPDENSSNTRISYYSKGAVVAFLLDAKIREVTGGEKSLDDVMRLMYKKHLKRGYRPKDFRAATATVAGEDLADWFALAVDSTEELDFDSMQDALGLEFAGRPRPKKIKEEDLDEEQRAMIAKMREEHPDAEFSIYEETEEDDSPGRPWLGFSTGGSGTVSRVEDDSPAFEAGINTEDEIIAINGYRISGSVDSRIRQYEIGEELELLIARRGKMKTVKITIGSRKQLSWRLKIQSEPTFEQKTQLAKWLDLELPEPEEQEEESEEAEESGEGKAETDESKEDPDAELKDGN